MDYLGLRNQKDVPKSRLRLSQVCAYSVFVLIFFVFEGATSLNKVDELVPHTFRLLCILLILSALLLFFFLELGERLTWLLHS